MLRAAPRRPLDVHCHIGRNDPDGFAMEPEELLANLDRAAHADGVVFPMHEPDGYGPANDEVLAVAAESGGRLQAFCRVNPHDGALAEARRCLDAGARGIKLHPRAERFTLDHPGVRPLIAEAHERRAPVLIHAGRGIPALGHHAVELATAFPEARLILAHAGICDLAWIWRAAQEHGNLFFDTAWWNPADFLVLFALVPPGQILLGTDPPYGSTALGAHTLLRLARQVGLDDRQIAGMLGGQAERLVRGEDPKDLGPAPGLESLRPDALLARVISWLTAALARLLPGHDGTEPLELTRLACQVPPGTPQAPVCHQVLGLLDLAERLMAEAPPERRGRAGVGPLVTAAVLAATPDVPLPEL
jgi:predicted TIM-barrel fold metal-dependent hydrolase